MPDLKGVVPVTSTPAVQITSPPQTAFCGQPTAHVLTAQPVLLPGTLAHTGAACEPLSAFSRCLKVARTPLTSGRVSTAGNSTASPLPLLPWAAGAAGASATPLPLLLLPPGMGAQGRAACGTNHSDSLLMNCWGCFARMASQSTCTGTAWHSTARPCQARNQHCPRHSNTEDVRQKLSGRSMSNSNAALLHVCSPSPPPD